MIDFYIIPLAKKLKECGVFGVSSDEYLNYAVINRRKWEEEGAEITAEMVARLKEPAPMKDESRPSHRPPPVMEIIDEGSDSIGGHSGHIANQLLDH